MKCNEWGLFSVSGLKCYYCDTQIGPGRDDCREVNKDTPICETLDIQDSCSKEYDGGKEINFMASIDIY